MSFGHVARIEIVWIKSNYAPLIGFCATSTYINSQHFGLSAYILNLHMPLWPQHNYTIITSIRKKKEFSLSFFSHERKETLLLKYRGPWSVSCSDNLKTISIPWFKEILISHPLITIFAVSAHWKIRPVNKTFTCSKHLTRASHLSGSLF